MSGPAPIADVSRAYPAVLDGGTMPARPSTPAPEVDFEDAMRRALEHADAMSHRATQRTEALASGASDDLHGTMIAVQEAQIGVHLVASVRNKLLDAFHELWHTSV